MPRIQPLLPFLRPLSAPRTPACRQFLQFSTATRLHIDAPAKPISKTSIPSETLKTTPNPTSPSTPAEVSRAADIAAAEAATEADCAQPSAEKPVLPSKRRHIRTPKHLRKPKPTPEEKAAKEAAKEAAKQAQREAAEAAEPAQRYVVSRSSNNNYPIYTDYKRGGNLHTTTVRKITGDIKALRDDLQAFLNKKDEDVRINQLTKHVIIKGHHVPQVTGFLKSKGF